MSWVQQNFRFLSLDTTLIESAIVGSSILYPVITDRLKTVTEYFSQIGKEEVHKKKQSKIFGWSTSSSANLSTIHWRSAVIYVLNHITSIRALDKKKLIYFSFCYWNSFERGRVLIQHSINEDMKSMKPIIATACNLWLVGKKLWVSS